MCIQRPNTESLEKSRCSETKSSAHIKKKKEKKSRQCSLESNCTCPPSMTQAGQVPQSTGREKTKGTPSSSTGLPLVHLAQQVASMNPTKNPKKIKPSQPAVSAAPPPPKIHHSV